MSTLRTREIELDYIRAFSMVMIIAAHTAFEAGLKISGSFKIVFLFMAGYLSYRPEYDRQWFARRLKRILPEYYIFIALYLIITVWFFKAQYSLKQVMINAFLLQGIFTGSALPNIGHLWFITYILICYALTPFAAKMMKKYSWEKLAALVLLLQVAVIPLRSFGAILEISRFTAYFIGLYFSMQSNSAEKKVQYKEIIKKTAIPVILLNVSRIICELSGVQERIPRLADKALGLLWQWSCMFLGVFLFFLLWLIANHIKNKKQSPMVRKAVETVSTASYSIYVVHQVFVYHDYAITRYVENYLLALAIALICIVASSIVLSTLSNEIRKLLNNKHEKALL